MNASSFHTMISSYLGIHIITYESRKQNISQNLDFKSVKTEPNNLSVIFNNIDKQAMAKKGNTFLDVFKTVHS